MDNNSIILILGFLVTLISVMTPIIKLNSTITKLNVTIETTSTGSGIAHENRPPYYALAYIMKIAE